VTPNGTHAQRDGIERRLTSGWAHRVQVALFDRIHSIRVKAIQEEYQRYMERVRTKAQNAIDQANTQYQHSRTMLTAHVDTLVHYLQNRHLQVRTCCRAGKRAELAAPTSLLIRPQALWRAPTIPAAGV
jgi:hypothetical protein